MLGLLYHLIHRQSRKLAVNVVLLKSMIHSAAASRNGSVVQEILRVFPTTLYFDGAFAGKVLR